MPDEWIPYGRQQVTDADVEAVVRALRSDWLTQGPEVEAFEVALAEAVGARYAVAFANGTAALHGAAAAADFGPGRPVYTSALSFVASANCARYLGAPVGFVDIDPATLNLRPEDIPAHADGLVAVHYAGLPVDLSRLGRRPRIVIEDAAHALGAETPSGPVGNCARSDMCVFSFHPVKTITTGEGGAVTTNSDEFASRLRRFRTHGITPATGAEPWRYDIADLGYNYRLSDIHAALGRSQLSRLPELVARRNRLAARYRERLTGTRVGLPPSPGDGYTHAYHLFTVQVPARREVYARLREAGIGVQVHYVPIHQLTAYADGAPPLPHTDAAYERILSLPMFPTLTDVQHDRVVAELLAAVGSR